MSLFFDHSNWEWQLRQSKPGSWIMSDTQTSFRSAFAPKPMYSLIVTAKLNDIDPMAWLADVLGRIAGHPAPRLDELLPWHWKTEPAKLAA